MEPQITDTFPRERDPCREENKPHVRVDTNRKEDIKKLVNSTGNHSEGTFLVSPGESSFTNILWQQDGV